MKTYEQYINESYVEIKIFGYPSGEEIIIDNEILRPLLKNKYITYVDKYEENDNIITINSYVYNDKDKKKIREIIHQIEEMRFSKIYDIDL